MSFWILPSNLQKSDFGDLELRIGFCLQTCENVACRSYW